VLAFVGDQCVGAGKVGMFRQDLLDAGLGDGHLGFRFPISLTDPQDAGKVVVRFEGTDALHMQRASVVSLPGQESRQLFGEQRARTIDWLRAQSFITDEEHELVETLARLGVATIGLRLRGKASADEKLLDVRNVVSRLLSLCFLQEVPLSEVSIPSLSDLSDLRDSVEMRGLPHGIVAVWTEDEGVVKVHEGSHNANQRGDGAIVGVDYKYGPNRLLFLNVYCRMQALTATPSDGFRVFKPRLAAESASAERDAA
jgi:hypothetical protein